MRKCLTKRVLNYCGKPATIKVEINDVLGYISITGDIIPYRCRTPHISGCIHAEISKYFPKLREYLCLHSRNVETGEEMHQYKNSLYHLYNGKADYAKMSLMATPEEFNELYGLAMYGIHHKKTRWNFVDSDSIDLWKKKIVEMGLPERWKAKIADFYKFVETI